MDFSDFIKIVPHKRAPVLPHSINKTETTSQTQMNKEQELHTVEKFLMILDTLMKLKEKKREIQRLEICQKLHVKHFCMFRWSHAVLYYYYIMFQSANYYSKLLASPLFARKQNPFLVKVKTHKLEHKYTSNWLTQFHMEQQTRITPSPALY